MGLLDDDLINECDKPVMNLDNMVTIFIQELFHTDKKVINNYGSNPSEIEDCLAGLVLIQLLQPGQSILLGCLQEGKQQFCVHAVAGFKRVGRPNLIAVLIPQHFQDICLIISLFF